MQVSFLRREELDNKRYIQPNFLEPFITDNYWINRPETRSVILSQTNKHHWYVHLVQSKTTLWFAFRFFLTNYMTSFCVWFLHRGSRIHLSENLNPCCVTFSHKSFRMCIDRQTLKSKLYVGNILLLFFFAMDSSSVTIQMKATEQAILRLWRYLW